MTFDDILDQILDVLRRQGRVSYWALKRRFDLHDDDIAGLKDEIITARRLAVDEAGKVLVWTGEAASAPATTPAPVQDRAPLAYTPLHLTAKILASRNTLEGERKQVTVLFADLKGSTELIASLDPEAARRLLDPALHLMMEAVHRYEGTVNQVLGDGIMALFGAPVAHEDHAVRACYAALAMQATMQRYAEEVQRTQGLAVQMRVGLNAGEVVVRAIGNDLHMDYSAVGQTTHLAARMEQLATPGSILLTATTLRLVEGLVRVNPMGLIPVKGLAEPVEVFELVAVTAIRRRLQAAVARGLSRFVGRDHELESLQQALQQAGAGHGQVAAIVGEAGVGKSRLVYEFVHSHRTQGWLVLESVSVSYGKATPYFPVLDLLRRYCHLEDGDDSRTIRAKVTRQVLMLDAALQEALSALLSLLDVLPEDDPFQQLDPPQRRQRTLNAFKRVLLRESQVQPLVLISEDLHWIDSETLALLDSLVESLPSARLLLLVNYRPEYQHGWGSKTYYTQLRLDPLPPARAEAFLAALLGDDPSLTSLTPLLSTRTAGNPFFLEESVRTLVETGVLVGIPGAYRLAQPLQGMPVQATVQAVLAARIDRLPPEDKRLLQTAAVLGTDVPLALLRAIADVPRRRCTRGWRICKQPSSCMRRGSSPNTNTPSSTPSPTRWPTTASSRSGVERSMPVSSMLSKHLPGTAWLSRSNASPIMPCGGGVGQSPGLLPAGRGKGPGTVGAPRGGRVLRAGAECPHASARATRHASSRPSTSGSPCARRSGRSADFGAHPRRLSARPRPSPRPSMIRVGWDGSRSF